MTATISTESFPPAVMNRIALLRPGEQLTLLDEDRPIATVTKFTNTPVDSRPGTACDRHFWMSDDFDEPLEDFNESMP